ncbi:MAG: zf-HC2 domain-containing protein [Lachnospiraceae bacterium]|nr:zf-HC2 domain-containing protein [Lachnospiraceae bacterium]
MNCLEAQTKIMAYIDNKLPEDQAYDFARHIEVCPKCAEELEIYYIMLVGMKQIDNNETLSLDFKKELKNKLDSTVHRHKNKSNLKASTFIFILLAVIGVGVFGYANFLNMVYTQEQKIKLSRQSEFYFYDSFGDKFLSSERIKVKEIKVETDVKVEDDKTGTFFNSIREYRLAHPNIDTEATEENEEE